MLKKIFAAILLTILILCANTADAAQNFYKPRLLIAEVANYGVNEIHPEVANNLYEALEKNLSDDFNVESRELLANLGGEPLNSSEIFSTIHMDAVAHGSLYRRELVNNEVKNYADSVLNFKDTKKNSNRKSSSKPYTLTSSVSPQVKRLGEMYGVDYMLFCDVRNADPLQKNVKVEMEYYLVNVKTGKVFEGQTFDKAVTFDVNDIIGSYRKDINADDMIQFVMARYAQQIEKGITGKGLKALRG